MTNLLEYNVSLKHGGRLFETDPLSCIIAPEKCTARINDMVIVLTTESGKEYVYPRPSNFVQNFTSYGYYKKGDKVGVSYRQFTPSYKLDSIIQLIGAAATSSPKRVINNKVLISECYAYDDGKITYNRVDDKITGVTIGSYRYAYEPSACYFLPEGSIIKKGQRFCTGTMNMYAAINNIKNYEELFYMFLKQFDELIPGMVPELIEFVYTLVVKNHSGRITYHRVASAIKDNPGTLNKMAFQNPRGILELIDSTGSDFVFDNIASLLLPTLLMHDYDE